MTKEIRALSDDEIHAVSGGLDGCSPGRYAEAPDFGPSWADIYNGWAARGRTLAAVSKAIG